MYWKQQHQQRRQQEVVDHYCYRCLSLYHNSRYYCRCCCYYYLFPPLLRHLQNYEFDLIMRLASLGGRLNYYCLVADRCCGRIRRRYCYWMTWWRCPKNENPKNNKG